MGLAGLTVCLSEHLAADDLFCHLSRDDLFSAEPVSSEGKRQRSSSAWACLLSVYHEAK